MLIEYHTIVIIIIITMIMRVVFTSVRELIYRQIATLAE